LPKHDSTLKEQPLLSNIQLSKYKIYGNGSKSNHNLVSSISDNGSKRKGGGYLEDEHNGWIKLYIEMGSLINYLWETSNA
jgi:hypothetical protein